MFDYLVDGQEAQAFQFNGGLDYSNGTLPAWWAESVMYGYAMDYYDHLTFMNVEGEVKTVYPGNWVVRDDKGCLFVIDNEVFTANYSKVE